MQEFDCYTKKIIDFKKQPTNRATRVTNISISRIIHLPDFFAAMKQ